MTHAEKFVSNLFSGKFKNTVTIVPHLLYEDDDLDNLAEILRLITEKGYKVEVSYDVSGLCILLK